MSGDAVVDREALAKAQVLSERATRMRSANDEHHAKLAEEAATEWRQASADLGATVEAENRARSERLTAADAGAEAERERAILDERLAHNGVLMAEYEGVDKAGAKALSAAASAAPAPAASGAPVPSASGGSRP